MTMSSNGEGQDGYSFSYRKPERKYTYLPRSRSMNDLPGGIRVPVVQRNDSRLKDRLEASLAGLEELKILRESHQKLFEEARETSAQTLRHANSTSELSTNQKQERVRRSSRRYSYCGLTGIQEESNNVHRSEQTTRAYEVGANSMSETGYNLRSRSRRPLSISDSESIEQTLRDAGTFPSPAHAQAYICKQDIENAELSQQTGSTQIPPSQEHSAQSHISPNRSGLTRRPSIQCEAILTGTSISSSNPNILSGVNLQCAFPSPLHAVLMQYGKNEKGKTQRRHSTVDHRSDKFGRFLQMQDSNNIGGNRVKVSFDTILEGRGQSPSRTPLENGTKSQSCVLLESATNGSVEPNDYTPDLSNDPGETCTRETPCPQMSASNEKAVISIDKKTKIRNMEESLEKNDEIPISQLTINNINKYNSMFADQTASLQKNSLKHLKRQMSLDVISEKCPNFIPSIADEKFRKMSQPLNFYSQLSKEKNPNDIIPKDYVKERRHSSHAERASCSSDNSERKSLSVLSDEGYCPSIPSTPRGLHKLSVASDCSWISADIDESTSNFDLSAVSKQDDEEGICDKENIDTLNRRRCRSRCDDRNNYGAKFIDDEVEESMKESVHKTFKQTSV